jgi:hypothetical protein
VEPLEVVDVTEPQSMVQERAPQRDRPVRIALALVVVLLLVSAGGALLRRDSRSPEEVIAAIPGAAAEVRTMAMEMEMKVEGPFTLSTTAEGVFDLDTGNSRFTIGVGERSLEMRTVDGTLYMKTPGPDGEERWLASPVPEGGTASGMLQTEPLTYLELMKAVSSDIDEVGRERIRGVLTTHYRFDIDPKKIDSPSAQFSPADLATAGIDTLPLDVWVGPDDLPRRIRMALGAAGSDIEIDIEMYDYGEPIVVEAPPEDLVTRSANADDLLRQVGEEAGRESVESAG